VCPTVPWRRFIEDDRDPFPFPLPGMLSQTPMHSPVLCSLALLLLAWPTVGQAATPLELQQIPIGSPADRERGELLCRHGAWTPVAVDLHVAEQNVEAGAFVLVLETADSNEVQTQYTAAIPALAAGQTHTLMTEARPGNRTGPLSVSIYRADNGKAV